MRVKEFDKTQRPTIVFGDIHGSTYWQEVVNEHPAYRYIFLGDYLDPYEDIPRHQLIKNLKKIIQLKKKRNDDVILLVGNHDLHYINMKIENYQQIVGHNRVDDIYEYENNNGKIIFCDCLYNKNYLKLEY